MFSNVFTGIEKRNKINAGNGFLLKIKPVVDVYETSNSLVILAEMPQVDKSNLTVQVENGILHIQGKRENHLKEGEYLYRETTDSLYERFFELEKNLDTDKIEASYHAGILKIVLPKKEEAQPKNIRIN